MRDAAAQLRHAALVVPAILGAWLIVVVAQLSGNARLLHHHALIEGGPPLWIGIPVFLVAWLVMIAAMMLPASLPAIAAHRAGSVAGLLGPYAGVWLAFGLAAFIGDFVLHHVVDATPWLAARPWLIDATVVGLAGAWQLTPMKGRALDACRHPASNPTHQPALSHAVACLESSWGLMLLTFAEGFANLWWMAALTGVMAYETIGPHGHRAGQATGIALLALAVGVLATGISV